MAFKGLKQLFRLALAIPLFWGATPARLYAATEAPPALEVAVVRSGEERLYTDMVTALRHSLPESVQVRSFALAEWQQRTTEPNSAVRQMTIAVGARATATLLDSGNTDPLLSLSTPSNTFDQLLAGRPQAQQRLAAGQMAAIYLDQPAARQVALARLLQPELSRLGTIYDGGADQLVAQLASEASAAELSFQARHLAADANPLVELKQLYGEIDFFIAVPGKFIFQRSTAKWMLYLSLRNKIPLLGFSEDYVRAGALAAVYSTPEHLARQAAVEVTHLLSDGRFTGESSWPRYFNVSVNRDVAAMLGVVPGSSEMLEWELSRVALDGQAEPVADNGAIRGEALP